MNKFNLTFSGEILSGHDPALVKQLFANMFGIDDPVRLESFFSGKTLILRRNLERKEAAQYFHDLQLLGVGAALVKVTASDIVDDIVNAPHPQKSSTDKASAFVRSDPEKPVPQKRATVAALPQSDSTSRPHGTHDAAAEIRARKLALQKQAEEKAALEKAVLREQQRQAAEVTARDQARASETLRAAEEERVAKEAEQARRAAELAARAEAERAEIKRVEAQEIARKKAQKEIARRKAEEEAAQRKARRKQQKAEKAKRKAEEAARRAAELEEKKRVAAEAETRRKAELAEINRLAAVEEARHKAELEEQKRRADEEEARRLTALQAIEHREAEEAARLQSELAEKARQAAAATAQIKADADHLLTQAQRSPVERLRKPPPKLTKPRVKTTLDIPLKKKAHAEQAGTSAQRRRVPGEPNLYTLRPFRNSEEVRSRAVLARKRMRQGYTVGVLALAVLLIAGGSFLQQRNNPIITGASAIAINSNLEPVLLAGDSLLFHDRAGVGEATSSISEMGLRELEPPLEFNDTDELLLLGQLMDNLTYGAHSSDLSLLRCNVSSASCQPFSAALAAHDIAFFAVNPVDESLLLADGEAGELLKVGKSGSLLARAAVTLAQQPVMRIHGGLLLMNSAAGPAISVLRYDDSAFGSQLDEILLLAPTNNPLEHYRVSDFIWSGNAWWVNLWDSNSGLSELHRFDEEWGYLDSINLPSNTGPLQLTRWGQKTLVNDSRDPIIQRYNQDGVLEAPFASTQLQALIKGQKNQLEFARLAWHSALLLCALTALAGFGFGYLHTARSLVYNTRREQGAEPLGEYTAQLHWIDLIENRNALLKKTGAYYGIAVLAALLLAIALSVSVWQLAALILALSGPGIALLMFGRQPAGHIGKLKDKLFLVDHTGMYHLAGGSRLQYRGPFLAIDDVIVFSGMPSLPAFSNTQIMQQIRPLALSGIKVDRKILMVKLLQARHPLALGAAAIVATLAGAMLILSLRGIF